MPTLDIRRHAQRQDPSDDQSPLSAEGRATCERLAKIAPRYALVLSSPLPRARETATRIAGRLDAVEPGLLPDLPPGVVELRTLAEWARLLRSEPRASRFAREQLPTWARIVSRVKAKDAVLAISHGGIIDLPAVLLARRLGARLDGAAFGYADGVRVTYAKGAPTKITVLRA